MFFFIKNAKLIIGNKATKHLLVKQVYPKNNEYLLLTYFKFFLPLYQILINYFLHLKLKLSRIIEDNDKEYKNSGKR
jgi:hypothetical protein